MPEQRLHGYCALCISRCGCISVVRDGVLTAVEPDPAHLTADIARGVVCAQYGWWQPCHELGLPGYDIKGVDNASYNTLLDGEVYDRISSSNGLRRAWCEIERHG